MAGPPRSSPCGRGLRLNDDCQRSPRVNVSAAWPAGVAGGGVDVAPESSAHAARGVVAELVDDVLVAREHAGFGPAHDVHDGAGCDALDEEQGGGGAPGVDDGNSFQGILLPDRSTGRTGMAGASWPRGAVKRRWAVSAMGNNHR